MTYADLPQAVKIAVIAKNDEIRGELDGFVAPPYERSEYLALVAIAGGALADSSLTQAQLDYLPTEAQASAWLEGYLGARATYNQRSAELEAVVTSAVYALETNALDEASVIAAIDEV